MYRTFRDFDNQFYESEYERNDRLRRKRLERKAEKQNDDLFVKFGLHAQSRESDHKEAK